MSVRPEGSPTGPPDLLERLAQPYTIVSGILDFVALLTGSPVADYCASARCLRDCRVLRVPVDDPPALPQSAFLSPAAAVLAEGGEEEGKGEEQGQGQGPGDNDATASAAAAAATTQRHRAASFASASSHVARCRLVRSCLIRAHRVTLSTAYAYLGVIYDLYPRHPVFPVTGSALTAGGLGPETLTLTARHQSALKRLVRLVLALEPDYDIPDLEHHLVPPSPRASPAPGALASGAGVVPPSLSGNSRPVSPTQQGQGQGHVDGHGNPISRSQTPANAAGASWSQPRLYLLRKGDSPHELDEQSRTSVHVIVTGRLAVARGADQQGQRQGAGGGGGAAGVGKSIFSDFCVPTNTSETAGADAGSAPSTPQRRASVLDGSGGGIAGSASPFLQPPRTPTPRMTAAALRGEVGLGFAIDGFVCVCTWAVGCGRTNMPVIVITRPINPPNPKPNSTGPARCWATRAC